MSGSGAGRADRFRDSNLIPVLVVLAAILVFWYGMAVWMNAPWQDRLNARAELTDCCVSPVLDFHEAARHPHNRANGFYTDEPVSHPREVIGFGDG